MSDSRARSRGFPGIRRTAARRAAACVGALLVVAFLAGVLTPCPPVVRVQIAAQSHSPGCHEEPASTWLSAPCDCGCGERAPMAGSSLRLGVALPSLAPTLAPRLANDLLVLAAPPFEGSFAAPIDHIPLPS